MTLIAEARGSLAILPLCEALDIPRSAFYRKHSLDNSLGRIKEVENLPVPHPRALKAEEREEVLDFLHSERFKDTSPAQVYSTLLDEGKYLCSERTMYRILASVGENRERRAVVRHGKYQQPELLATGPNQVWSWDITRRTPGRL